MLQLFGAQCNGTRWMEEAVVQKHAGHSYVQIKHFISLKGDYKISKHPTLYTFYIYRVSIKSFPDYRHLLQENYVEYKYFFFSKM